MFEALLLASYGGPEGIDDIEKFDAKNFIDEMF